MVENATEGQLLVVRRVSVSHVTVRAGLLIFSDVQIGLCVFRSLSTILLACCDLVRIVACIDLSNCSILETRKSSAGKPCFMKRVSMSSFVVSMGRWRMIWQRSYPGVMFCISSPGPYVTMLESKTTNCPTSSSVRLSCDRYELSVHECRNRCHTLACRS